MVYIFIVVAAVCIFIWAAKCPHGSLGGRTQDRCQKCVQEKAEASEREQRAREARQRQQQIDDKANELRRREQLRLAKLLVPSLKKLRKLNPYRFEYLVADMFKRLGYAAEQTPYSNDHGRDMILSKGGRKVCRRVQEIRWKQTCW